jgi:LPXTG-motif cell wall-anchored protein
MRASKKVMGAVLLTSSAALVLGAPTVHADSSADGNNGLLGGLNLLNGVQLNVPVTVGGAGVLGVGTADTTVTSGNTAGGTSTNSGGGSSSADNNNALVGGLNVGNNLQASVPVTACGVGALLAKGTGDCTVKSTNVGGGGGSSSANGNSGLVGGVNALNDAQLSVPVTVCGLAVLGDANCKATVAATNAGGGSGSGAGSSSANGNSGLIGGLNLLNNLQLSVPVTVCGLAVLGDADAACEVTASNNGGGSTTGDVAGESRDQGSSVRGATLPHTGAASMALIPFGLALVAGGVALRRRVAAEA